MNTGANVRVIPLGKDVAVIHVVSVALRAALIFGNVTPGDAGTLMKYTMDRVPAFVNAFGPLDDVVVACGAGAIALGFPVITNETENIFRVPKSLIVQEDVSKFNATSLEARDIKIKITNIDIPVAFASAFEGEIIRRKDMRVEFDGSRVDCAELVHTCDSSEVEDHKITVVGQLTRWKMEARTALLMLLKFPVRTCSQTLSRLSSVNSTTTSTVSRVYTIQAREICSVSVSAMQHLMHPVSNILVRFCIHRLRMSLMLLLTSVKL